MRFKFWALGRVYHDLKRRISLCTDHFSSERTKWKEDGHLLKIYKPSAPSLDQIITLPRDELIALLLSFLFPLDSNSQNPGLPGMIGNIKFFEILV